MKKHTLRKLLSTIIAAAMLLALLPNAFIPASAAEYDLLVAGVKVTDANKSDILGDGAFSYSDELNRLTVRGDCTSSEDIVESDMPGLEVYIAEDVTLRSDEAVFDFNYSAVITGPGKLTAIAGEIYVAISVYNTTTDATLIIKDAWIDVTGRWGINGGYNSSNNERLIIQNSYVHACNADGFACPIGDFRNGIYLSYCTITLPEDGNVAFGYNGLYRILDSNGYNITEVTIEPSDDPGTLPSDMLPEPTAFYDLIVAGVGVNDANESDILGNGVFSYDPGANELTIHKDFSYDKDNLIDNEIKNLRINAFRNVTLTTPGVVIHTTKDLTIKGEGMLTMKSAVSSCVYAERGATVTLDTARVNVGGSKYGLRGTDTSTNEKVVIKDSFLDGLTNNGSVTGFRGGVNYSGCEILSPSNPHIENGAITTGQNKPANWVTIAFEYDLWIAGFRVNNGNAPDVMGDGVFEYYDRTKTLFIKGDFDYTYVNEGDDEKGALILDKLKDLTVYVAEESELRSNSDVIRVVTYGENVSYQGAATLTIEGPGKLRMRSHYNCINLRYDALLTLDHADVDMYSSADSCIWDYYSHEGKLVIDESTLHARGYHGAIACINEVELIDCEVVDPPLAKFKDGAFRYRDEIVEELTIRPMIRYGVTVAGVEVTSLNANNVLGDYSVSYTPVLNELMLHKDITYSDGSVIDNENQGLTIYVGADVTLRGGSSYPTIQTSADLTVTGSGKLTLARGLAGVLVTGGAALTLSAVDLTVKDGRYGIWGGSGDGDNVDFRYSRVVITSSYSAVSGFGSVTLNGCQIDAPSGGRVQGGSIVDRDGGLAANVTIFARFKLWIGGIQITSDNFNRVFEMTNKVMSYDPSSNTLAIYGGSLDYASNVDAIRTEQPGLTIYVEKYTTINGGDAGLGIGADTTITGRGTLELNPGGSTVAVAVRNGATLTLDKASLTVSAANASVGIDAVHDETLVVRDSRLYVKAKSYGILNFDSIVLDRSELVTPSDGCIENGSVFTNSDCTAYATYVYFEPQGYNVWVSGTRINTFNASDVFLDGTVRFYDKGEYVPTELDLEYGYDEISFRYTRVLVLDNYKAKDMYYREDDTRSAQLYIDDDIFVVLKGENTFTNGTYGNYLYDGDACHGVYIGQDYVHFIGDGSLETYAGWCDRDGLYGEGASVYFCEEVKVTLKGKYGLHQIFNYDTPYVTVEDNAKLTCVGLGTDNADYPALDCAGVEIYNHGELICKTDGWGDAMDTWGSGYAEFPNDYYDILILKKGEFASGSNWNGEYTEPYKPEKGINVKDGVWGTDCHYIRIKGKTVLATSAWFNNSTYTVTPEKNDITIIFGLGPVGAADIDYSDIEWECSDNSVIMVMPTGKNRAVVTGFLNGTATVTITAKGGATASCTVVASGFGFYSPMKGDFDGDGEITVADALAALRIAAKLAEETYESIIIGDIDYDETITVSDALAILRVAAKLASPDSLNPVPNIR
ncbi:MAG: dockerin type I repeat-containing protein [Clostridia bacterium]|nr:dockerin type I repeat-containing protein [Clostridia bacterium]